MLRKAERAKRAEPSARPTTCTPAHQKEEPISVRRLRRLQRCIAEARKQGARWSDAPPEFLTRRWRGAQQDQVIAAGSHPETLAEAQEVIESTAKEAAGRVSRVSLWCSCVGGGSAAHHQGGFVSLGVASAAPRFDGPKG